MKLPPFDYACPTTLPEAVQLLAARDGDAKAIAGGQSLVPMLAFRLAQPTLLVDLRKLPDLRGIKISEKGVTLGAMVRWRDIEDDERLDAAHPLLKAAIAHVAHYQVRNRGTVGGSLAHADPAAEMPGIALTCDAEIAVVGKSGAHVIQAADFFQGALTTALTPDEIIVEIRLPAWPAGRRWGFEEFARRRGARAAAGAWRIGRGAGATSPGGRRRFSTTRTRPARSATPMSASSALPTGRCASLGWKASSMDEPLMRQSWPRPRLPPPPLSIRRTIFMPAPPIVARSSERWSNARSSAPPLKLHPAGAYMSVRFRVNGQEFEVEVEPRLTLADCLRHHLRLTGTHVGCEHGVWGPCTLLLTPPSATPLPSH